MVRTRVSDVWYTVCFPSVPRRLIGALYLQLFSRPCARLLWLYKALCYLVYLLCKIIKTSSDLNKTSPDLHFLQGYGFNVISKMEGAKLCLEANSMSFRIWRDQALAAINQLLLVALVTDYSRLTLGALHSVVPTCRACTSSRW